MTGFGRGAAEAGGRAYIVEARSVNHRHLDVAVRAPRELSCFEEPLRALVRARLHRGRVDLALAVAAGAPGARALVVDTDLAAQYHEALRDLAGRLGVPMTCDAATLAALPGVLSLAERPADAGREGQAAARAAEQALEALEAMRAREGAALAEALREALAAVEAQVCAVEARVAAAAVEREAALRARLRTLLADPERDFGPAVAATLERADIREELVRCRSHLAQARACLDAAGPVGRRLDFLAQELQREWTTIAGKAVDREVADRAVLARVAAEQVREQALNVE